jgi:hypothetical protein
MRPLIITILTVFAISMGGNAHGDEPLSPPTLKTDCSPSGEICSEMDPHKGTIVYRMTEEKRIVLWTMPGWFRAAYISDDGIHMVTGYDGLNLLGQRNPNETMLQFWAAGNLLRSVPLEELLPDLSNLERTASHWNWGYYVGFDSDSLFVVETVDKKRHRYNVITGKRTNH